MSVALACRQELIGDPLTVRRHVRSVFCGRFGFVLASVKLWYVFASLVYLWGRPLSVSRRDFNSEGKLLRVWFGCDLVQIIVSEMIALSGGQDSTEVSLFGV